jgi:hypothetical protein
MQIEDFKRWHWALLGLLAGLIFAFAWQDHDVVGDKTYAQAEIKQVIFEREALSKTREVRPELVRAVLQDVRVEPPVKDYENNIRQIVIGKRVRFNPADQKEYLVPFYYYASVPYVPRLPPVPGTLNLRKDGKPATVMDFLAAAQTTNKLLNFRYAWELENNWFIALWAVGGVVVIGGIWPTILNLLLGAGLGRPPKTEEEKANEEYLSRFGKGKKKPKPVLAAKGPTDADLKQLDSMNAALEGELAAAGMSLTSAAPAPSDDGEKQAAPAAVVPLNAEPVKPAPHERQHGETEEEYQLRYKPDDFYPVARSTHTKKE